MKEIKAKKICINCLNKGHIATTCNSSACRRCQKKYNILLQQAQEAKSTTDQKSNEISASKPVVTKQTQDTMCFCRAILGSRTVKPAIRQRKRVESSPPPPSDSRPSNWPLSILSVSVKNKGVFSAFIELSRQPPPSELSPVRYPGPKGGKIATVHPRSRPPTKHASQPCYRAAPLDQSRGWI